MQQHKIITMIKESRKLPELPEDVSQVINILKNPIDVDINLLIEKIGKAPELNELMLKSINSGYFQLGKEIKTIKEAVVYLGLQTVQNMLIFFMTRQLFPKKQLFPKNVIVERRTFDMQKYWRHVLGTSVAACLLSAKIKKGDKYKLFSYGLIHDIGILVLDTCMPEMLDEITSRLLKGVHQIIAEKIVLKGITHSEIGAWLCRKWNIRNDITNIVEYHHTPLAAQDGQEDVNIIYLADVISTEYYEKLLGLHQDRVLNYKIMDALVVSEDDINDVARVMPGELEKLEYYFSSY